MPRPQKYSWSLLSLILVVFLASCGGFDRQWKAAASSATAAPSIEGRWEGIWKSSVTGHTGKLRCVVGSPANSAGDQPFTYRATWGPVFRGSFATTHRVHREKNAFSFTGEHKMPAWAGGVYSYDGQIGTDGFKATYRSSKDSGVFEMNRPKK